MRKNDCFILNYVSISLTVNFCQNKKKQIKTMS